jgi:hypothetical protein
MKKIALLVAAFGAALLPLTLSAPAQAQATRTWVSGVGDDVNPCSRTAPCKTFAGAISKTAANGEISVLDPGGFGAVTITKSITINGDGTLAGILSSGVTAVNVTTTAGIKVVLRNLSINGGGTGLNGVRVLVPSEVVIDKCTFEGYTGVGVDVSTTGTTKVSVVDSSFTDGGTGINATSTTGIAFVSVRNSRFYNLTVNGMVSSTNGAINVDSSVLTQMPNAVLANGNGIANVTNSQFMNNANAVNNSAAGSQIRVSNNDFIDNTNNFVISAGTIRSAGNNRIVNGSGAPNGTPIPSQ